MNCKPGDLAFIVKAGNKTNLGRVVRCVRLSEDRRLLYPDGIHEGSVWEVEPEIQSWRGAPTNVIFDRFLRPIRPGDISDEEVRDLYAPKIPEAA